MADQSFRSPINPHFFKPLLPGFHTHINIPVVFFSKHIEGRNDHIKTTKLRTDASAIAWLVKVDGLKFTDGWEAFAVAHDLRIGDIIIFRHEGEMVFHVTALGPSCCEIQYASASSHNINENSNNQTNNIVTGNSSRVKRKRVKKNHSQFVAHVSPSSLRFDRLYLPMSFARSISLDKMGVREIILLNEEGRSWKLNLKYNKAGMQTFVRPGWRRFCAENGMKQSHHYTFKLVQKAGPPTIRLCRAEHRPKPVLKSSLHHSCYVGSLTSYSLKNDKLYLGRKFVVANGLEGFNEIVLKNEWGGRWTLALRRYKSLNHTYVGPGWTTFCQVNGIKAGDSFMFKLIETEEKPIFSLCPSNRDKTPLECPEHSDDSSTSRGGNSEKESLEDDECFEMEKKKNSSSCRASSSYSQDRFVRLTLTLKAAKNYKLILPMGFTRVNGINKAGKITLLHKDGVRQVVDLLKNKGTGTMRIGKGWREFCDAHGVKIGKPFVLELMWEGEASPVLTFCTNL